MSYKVRWRKAVALSVFFHMLFGVAVGYMTVRLSVSPPVDEQFIELDVAALPGDDPAEPEPQIASSSIPAPEVPSQENPDQTESVLLEPPPVVSDPLEVSDSIPSKTVMTELEKPTVVISNKQSMMGTPPVVLVRVDPVNPSEVDQIGRKIIVVLRMKIMENGFPGKVEVAVSSGQKSINDAAIAAAKKWRFEPAKDREGHPIVCSTILSIPFTPK